MIDLIKIIKLLKLSCSYICTHPIPTLISTGYTKRMTKMVINAMDSYKCNIYTYIQYLLSIKKIDQYNGHYKMLYITYIPTPTGYTKEKSVPKHMFCLRRGISLVEHICS